MDHRIHFLKHIAAETLGDSAAKVWSDPKFSWKLLSDENWKCRYIGFTALKEVWKLDKPELVGIARILAEKDPHEQIVILALRTLGKLNAGSYETELSQFLSSVVNDLHRTDRVKICAYESLDQIHSPVNDFLDSAGLEKKVKQWKEQLKNLKSKTVDDIDWSFVNQFKTDG